MPVHTEPRFSDSEFCRLVLEQAAVGVAVADRELRFVDANPRFCEILGCSLAELRNTTILAITHPEDVDQTRAHLARLVAGEIPQYTFQKRYVRKDGRTIWSHTTTTTLRDAAGRVCNFVGVIAEIGERKVADEVRNRLVALVESSDDAIISKTLDGVITSWNGGAERIFGYAPSEVIGKPIMILIPPDHRDEEPAILARLRRGERIDHYETVRQRKDGSLLHVSLTVSPIRDRHGTIIGASKIARDITLQRTIEREAGEHAQALEALNVAGASIAAQLDARTLVQTVTDAATQLSGAECGAFFYSVGQRGGQMRQLSAVSGASREALASLGQLLIAGDSITRSADITTDPRYQQVVLPQALRQGDPAVRSSLAVPVVSRSGVVIGALVLGHSKRDMFSERVERLVTGIATQAAIALDNARLYAAAQREIVSRERAETALRETDRRKDEFLATLAHELRNPLAPIRQAALISKAPGATEAQKRWSHDVIDRQVQHMSLLLNDLLDVSRITRGSIELRTEITDLAAVVDAAVETARPWIDAKEHVLEIELPAEPVYFAADPLRLAQVLSNLLTNAAKYTDPRGTIHVRGAHTGDRIVIRVSDNGIGIPADALSEVFAMFSQVKAAQDRSDGGLGIGLALSKGIIELHGGSLAVTSAGSGQGSEFTLELPIRDVVFPRPHAEIPASAAAVISRRVLIADDNRDAADSLAILLRMEGHEVTVVHDGRAALADFDAIRPELVLLDIGMPGLNGYEVARHMRHGTLGRAVTLVAITGWGQDADKARALAAGFNHHFTKPIEPGRIAALLRSERFA